MPLNKETKSLRRVSLVQRTRRQAKCYYGCSCSSLDQLSSWLIFSLGKFIILVIGESPATDRTLSGATTPVQRRPGSDGNEGVLCVHQSSSITWTSPLDLFSVISLVRSYPTGEKLSVFFIAPVDWANIVIWHRRWLYGIDFSEYSFPPTFFLTTLTRKWWKVLALWHNISTL